MSWNQERVADLLKYRDMGLSSSLIAAKMGGLSRNAVIGKLHRLGLKGSTPTQRRKCGAPTQMKRPPRVNLIPKKHWFETVTVKPIKPSSDVARVKILDLEPHHCRFPVGAPEEATFGFCGETKVPGQSYCSGHLHRCVVGPDYLPRTIRVNDRIEGEQTASASAEEFLQPA